MKYEYRISPSEENKGLRERIEQLEIQLHQARGALGYPVPGHIPEGDMKCGLCEDKRRRIIEADAQVSALCEAIRLIASAQK
jgi:hypothetical protein